MFLVKNSNTKGSVLAIFTSQHVSWCAGFEIYFLTYFLTDWRVQKYQQKQTRFSIQLKNQGPLTA